MVLLITIDYQTSKIKYVWNALHRQDEIKTILKTV